MPAKVLFRRARFFRRKDCISHETIGVALKAATVPEVGKPGFTLPEDEIEFGVGIHGEPGYRREKSNHRKS